MGNININCHDFRKKDVVILQENILITSAVFFYSTESYSNTSVAFICVPIFYFSKYFLNK